MSKYLQLGKGLRLPIDWITLATVVYGARGSGKTSFGRVTAEEAHKAGQRFCAIDLKGDWYGLKSSADGKSDGLEVVVFGGEHADVPLEPDAGAFVGETVAKLEQSTILDFELFSKGKQIRFLASFFEALYHHNREPLLLLLDEAQRYAPQKPGPDEARTLGAVQDLVKLGRKHGIGPVLFTQRGAGLSKEVSELCDLLVAFRTPGPLDQDRIKDWLDANATKPERELVMGQLSGLATGTAVFASGHPELKTFGVFPVRRPDTFDSSATPKVGQRRLEPKKLAKADLTAITAKMADAIERAKADDPKALRARIADLEKQAAKVKAPPVAPAVKPTIERVEVPVLVDVPGLDEIAALNTFEQLDKQLDQLVSAATRTKIDLLNAKRALKAQLTDYRKAVDRARADASKRAKTSTTYPKCQPDPLSVNQAQPRESAHPPSRQNGTSQNGGAADASLGKGELAVLTAIAQHHDGVTREQLTVLTGYKRSSRDAYLQRLRAAGHTEETGGRILATDGGRRALGSSWQPLPTGAALREHWLGRLPEGERAVLEIAIAAHPDWVTRDAISDSTGYKRSSRDAYIQRLRARRLLADAERGGVKASGELF